MTTTEVKRPAEDTMLYRAEVPESDVSRVADIWGRKLETTVVDASEVDDLVAQGWARHPSEIADDGKVTPKKDSGDKEALTKAADALEAANQREAALQAELDQARETEKGLIASLDTIQTERAAMVEEITALRTRAETAEAEVIEARALIAAVDGDGDGKPGGSKKKAE